MPYIVLASEPAKELTLSLPSSQDAFSQLFEEICTSEVVRIGSIIIFHLRKL